MEFILGITDVEPKHWMKQTMTWEDEKLKATSNNTFHAVVDKLCQTALKKRRPDDYGIDSHMWNLKIYPSLTSFLTRQNNRNVARWQDDSSADDSDEDEEGYRRPILVAPREHHRMYQDDFLDDEEYELIESETETLSSPLLPKDSIIHFAYDFVTESHIYLKVISVRPVVAGALLAYLVNDKDSKSQVRELESVPAFSFPDEKRIDAFYPHFSKAFFSKQVGSVTWGLSSKIRSEEDLTFCAMENSNCSSDSFFCIRPFKDMNEFMEIAEEAWTPNPKLQQRYRSGAIMRHVFQASEDDDKAYKTILDHTKTEWAQFGPKILLFRKKIEYGREAKKKKKDCFDFAKAFPRTLAHFQSGKFRWLKYKNGVLRVMVGRASGHDNRQFREDQILRTWRRKFQDLHELLCAVEASWVYQKKPLEASDFINQFDADLGPSDPAPKDPDVLANAADCVVLSLCNEPTKKMVTVLEIARETSGKMVLYSGYTDGTLTKWCLETNKQIWSKSVFRDWTDHIEHVSEHIGVNLEATGGVAGLILRPTKKQHLLYAWSHVYSVQNPYDLSKPAEIRCFDGVDGRRLSTYNVDVFDGIYPSIATVVLCRLWQGHKNNWIDSLVVGFHATCASAIDWEGDYSNFDLEEARSVGEGNILPIDVESDSALETWREHQGIIRAMAVMPEHNYLLSYSIRPGHGFPDAMVLWSLTEPGVVLCRHNFWDYSTEENFTRLIEVQGISVFKKDVLLAARGGDQVVSFSVVEARNRTSLRLNGYGTIGNRRGDDEAFFGSMASSGSKAIMSNESFHEGWIFDISSVATDDARDTREESFLERDLEGDEDEDEKINKAGRELAIGKVEFPPHASPRNQPERKRRKLGSIPNSTANGDDDESIGSDDSMGGQLWYYETDNDAGEGGPVAHAMFGRMLISGFLNGSIVRSPLLPESFQDDSSTKVSGTGGLVSCSRISSCEWTCPDLHRDGGEDSDSDADY